MNHPGWIFRRIRGVRTLLSIQGENALQSMKGNCALQIIGVSNSPLKYLLRVAALRKLGNPRAVKVTQLQQCASTAIQCLKGNVTASTVKAMARREGSPPQSK